MGETPKQDVARDANEMAQARAALYGLLSRVFSGKPTGELLKGLKEKATLDALAAFEVVFEPDFIAGEDERQAQELAVEYTRLFHGPGPHIAPYESVFVHGEGEDKPRLWGEATAKVAEFYRQAGLEVDGNRMPDHLGLEFAAMAALAEAEAARRNEEDYEGAARLKDLQNRFCSEHLLRWVPDLCRVIESGTRSSFYRGMAHLAQNQVKMQCGATN
jgi:TorA maturation chaperone TorD